MEEWRRDHPRMRGENAHLQVLGHSVQGSPPHARGKYHLCKSEKEQAGITPACAGKISYGSKNTFAAWDHPRMRGENRWNAVQDKTGTGITPACAGKISFVSE